MFDLALMAEKLVMLRQHQRLQRFRIQCAQIGKRRAGGRHDASSMP